jgi:hypothetical protein
MSELDKLVAFGQWLLIKQHQQQAELFSLSVNRTMPVDAIRIKAGHIEATQHILEAFTELYKGDLNKFKEERLGQKPEEDDKEPTDESSPRPA